MKSGRRVVRRSLLTDQGKATKPIQHLSVDDFKELPGRKRDARRRGQALGHDLGTWHRRKNDPYGRWNAFCRTCNLAAVVCTEAPDYMADPVYGHALTERCTPRGGR